MGASAADWRRASGGWFHRPSVEQWPASHRARPPLQRVRSTYYMQKVRYLEIDAASGTAIVCERAKLCLRAFVAALIAAACCTTASANSHSDQPWRVVMLYGSDYMLPAVVMHNQALQRTLEGGSPRRIDFYSDAVDAQRFDGS